MSILEGKEFPVIIYSDNTTFNLPEPTGPSRGNLRLYEFKEMSLSSYISEGGNLIDIGKKFLFEGNIYWEKVGKHVLKALWKASADPWVWFVLNNDKPDIKYKVKVLSPKYKFTQGLQIAYSISLTVTGYEKLSAPGYGDLENSGFGFNFGNTQSGQTP